MWDQASKTQCWKKLWHSDIVITFNISGKEVICEILIVHLKKKTRDYCIRVSHWQKTIVESVELYLLVNCCPFDFWEKNLFPLYSTNMTESKTWSNKFENIVIGCKWLNAQFWAVRAPSSCFNRGKLHMHFHQWTEIKWRLFAFLSFSVLFTYSLR